MKRFLNRTSSYGRRLYENKSMCECGSGMNEDECTECGSGNYMMEKEMCECGSGMNEDECTECGRMESEVYEKLSKAQKRELDVDDDDRITAKDFEYLRRNKAETKRKKGEVKEKLHGNQYKIDRNKNNKIDAEDFKMLRKESVYSLVVDGKRHIFSENEMIDIIEKIVLEEKKKKNKKTNTTKKKNDPIKTTKNNIEKSGKENKEYIDSVVKKMKDYLVKGSKGSYDMNPTDFPRGNGEIEKMEKMAYIPSNAVQDYVDNFTAAGLENLDFDEIQPNEKWVEDLVMGSSRTGNNPEWANAVETPNNKKRNEIRKNNLLSKIRKKAANKAPQPVVSDKSGYETDDASKILMKLESKKEQKVMTDIEKMKNLISYGKKTQ